MRNPRVGLVLLLVIALAAFFLPRADAATAVPLAQVVPCEPQIVAGEVLSSTPHQDSRNGAGWTEVRLNVQKVWRGQVAVGETSIFLPAGANEVKKAEGLARLTPGRFYILFLEGGNFQPLSVREQGVFEVVGTTEGPRAINQAAGGGRNSAVPGGLNGFTLDALSAQIANLQEDPCGGDGGGGGGGGGGGSSCIPDGGVDDTLYVTHCCSGFAVNGSTVCSNPSDYGTTWASCNQVCGTAPVNGCIPSGGIDDTLYSTYCCSGVAVGGSTWCLNPAHYGTTWASCVQTCA